METMYAVLGADRTPREGLSESQVRRELREGLLGPETLAWRPGLEGWAPLRELLPEEAPPPVASAPAPFRIELALDPAPDPAPKEEPAPVSGASAGFRDIGPVSNPYQAPQTQWHQGPDPDEARRALGLRIAGALILVNALLTIYSLSVGKGSAFFIGSLVVDLIVGVPLAMGRAQVRTWAVLRCSLGLLLGPLLLGLAGSQGAVSWPFAVANTAYCGGLLLLLWGETLGLARLVVGSVLGGGIFVLALMGLARQGLKTPVLSAQNAGPCHLSMDAYAPFKIAEQTPPDAQVMARFEDLRQATSTADQGGEVVLFFESKPDFHLDVDQITRKTFKDWMATLGNTEPVDEGQTRVHGALSGLECQGRLTVHLQGLELRAFGFSEGSRAWVVLLALPDLDSDREAHFQRILDSIRLDPA